jgi:hypothetical protein
MARPYSNRRYLKELATALRDRSDASLRILAAQTDFKRAEDELERLGLDPLSFDDLLDVEADGDPCVFYCDHRDASDDEGCTRVAHHDLEKADAREVFCTEHESA